MIDTLRRWLTPAFWILLALFLLEWVLLFSIQSPTWDEVSYYIYARSAVFDHDLHFANDFQLSYPTASPDFVAKAFDTVTTPTGHVVNLFAIGSPLLWLPWLVALRGAVAMGVTSLSAETLTGYELLFTSNLATLSALFGFGAFWLSYQIGRRVVRGKLALVATATLMLATPLLYYQFRAPLYSHTASALMVAAVVAVWLWRVDEDVASAEHALVLGALIGLAGLVRWQNLLYGMLPVAGLLLVWLQADNRRETARRAVGYLALAGVAALAVFSLQMAVWTVLYGSPVTIPQGSSFMDWRAPFLMPLLFSTFRGLLPWMPVFFLALLGLGRLAWSRPRLGVPLLVVLMLALYANAATRDWFAGAGYGPRRLTSELALLVLGYGAFLDWLPRRVWGWVAAALGLLLAAHQWLLLRYGLANRLGGRVLSMDPTFRWEDQPLSQFLGEMAQLIPQALAEPVSFFVLPGSPLAVWLNQARWPVDHVTALLLTSAVVGLFLLLMAWLVKRWPSPRPALVGGLLLAAVLLADWWILAFG